jgi:SagB-type dehydrogenase family enzyme
MFRAAYPVAWTFHRNTCYWRYQPGNVPSPAEPAGPFKEYLDQPLVPLPAAQDLAIALGAAIQARLSCRRFLDSPLPLPTLATLLHTCYGIQGSVPLGDDELLTRPVPSGGALYPLELYLLVRQVTDLRSGIYHYSVPTHALELLDTESVPLARLTEIFMGQSYAGDAALVVVLTAVPARALWKYADRGYRLILLEAGHVAQTLNLAAAALGWGCVNLGGFLDMELGNLIGLDNELEVPLYAIALGRPDGSDSSALRQS